MGRYDDENYGANSMRQKDIVLSSNEYVFIQNKTNGIIKTYTGPIMATISQQESLVVFDERTKRFKETTDFELARQLFVSAPEGWYVVLKNPAKDNAHPETAKPVNSPELEIGRKINVFGPCSFSLFPGQMAKAVRGHRLRSNQYLLARVYDADAANKSVAITVDAEGNEVIDKTNQYFVGQLLVIKGTEISFYMPPTGIEVISEKNEYVRDAITLERLEYVILKDEDGEKRYVHGPAVVFPKPTETFVETPKGGNIFRALELSPISGIYIKVIADYKDDNGVEHPIGEELFITGNDQMIYYPRSEHALIQYDGKYMHHAIAIPEGEGRYILNRLTGEIKTVVGPRMYLPDPRTEVVVQRKLSEDECRLMYPGNDRVLEYNYKLSEKMMESRARKGITSASTDAINCAYSTSNSLDSLAIFEANANISRGVSYTKPRTITLDTKLDGVVAVNVWSGYAVNVVSKTGVRETVIGPMTRLLNYDETLEPVNTSEGRTVYLKLNGNRVASEVIVSTADGVTCKVLAKVVLDFDPQYAGKWFNTNDYPACVRDTLDVAIRDLIKSKTFEEVSKDGVKFVTEAIQQLSFKEQYGLVITNTQVREIGFEEKYNKLINTFRDESITTTLRFKADQEKLEVSRAAEKCAQEILTLKAETEKHRIETENEVQKLQDELKALEAARENALKKATLQAESDMQSLLDAIHERELARQQAIDAAEFETQRQEAGIEAEKQRVYAETVKTIISSATPDLVAALTTKANADLLTEGMKNMAPWAIAKGESVPDTINTLLRGTALEELVAVKTV